MIKVGWLSKSPFKLEALVWYKLVGFWLLLPSQDTEFQMIPDSFVLHSLEYLFPYVLIIPSGTSVWSLLSKVTRKSGIRMIGFVAN